jgi:hypothetical protein
MATTKQKQEDVTEATTEAPVTVDGVVVDVVPYEVAYYYLPARNTDGAFYPGVPLADLTPEMVETYPKWIVKSIKASPMYKAANASDEDEGEGGNK